MKISINMTQQSINRHVGLQNSSYWFIVKGKIRYILIVSCTFHHHHQAPMPVGVRSSSSTPIGVRCHLRQALPTLFCPSLLGSAPGVTPYPNQWYRLAVPCKVFLSCLCVPFSRTSAPWSSSVVHSTLCDQTITVFCTFECPLCEIYSLCLTGN